LRALRPISTQTLRLHGCRVRPQMRRWEHLHAEREIQGDYEVLEGRIREALGNIHRLEDELVQGAFFLKMRGR